MSNPAQAAPSEHFPVTDRVREGLAVSLRGCEELLPEADWLKKLARSEATGKPLRRDIPSIQEAAEDIAITTRTAAKPGQRTGRIDAPRNSQAFMQVRHVRLSGGGCG